MYSTKVKFLTGAVCSFYGNMRFLLKVEKEKSKNNLITLYINWHEQNIGSDIQHIPQNLLHISDSYDNAIGAKQQTSCLNCFELVIFRPQDTNYIECRPQAAAEQKARKSNRAHNGSEQDVRFEAER